MIASPPPGIHRLLLSRESGPVSAVLALINLSNLKIDDAVDEWLHPDEKTILEAMKYERRRNAYLVGRIAAKRALCELLSGQAPTGLNVQGGVFGQPVVTGSSIQNIQVSISHVGEWGCGLAFYESHPMGVDLERPGNTDIDLVRSQCTGHERALIDASCLSPAEACATFWTMKESLSKVLRSGLMSPLDTYEIQSIAAQEGLHVGLFSRFAQYKAVSFNCSGVRISVTLPKNTRWDIPVGATPGCPG